MHVLQVAGGVGSLFSLSFSRNCKRRIRVEASGLQEIEAADKIVGTWCIDYHEGQFKSMMLGVSIFQCQ